MTEINLLCIKCKHLKPGRKCKAFPEMIPDDIFITADHDHHKFYPGDKGVVFEPIEDNKNIMVDNNES